MHVLKCVPPPYNLNKTNDKKEMIPAEGKAAGDAKHQINLFGNCTGIIEEVWIPCFDNYLNILNIIVLECICS